MFDFANIFENVFGSMNVLENIFDSVNVSIGGKHLSIVVPLDMFKFPNVLFWYVSNVITYAAGTCKKAFIPIVDNVSPQK